MSADPCVPGGEEGVRLRVDGRVLVVTIDRPRVRNAVDGATARALAAAFDRLDADPALGAAVLTGAGGGFSAGMDLRAFAEGDLPFVGQRGFGGFAQSPPRKPVVAAVEGYALAGGLEMALACDLIVAAEDARLGLPEVRRGLVAAGGGLLRLAQRIPYHVAAEIALTGEPVSARRLHEVGLLNRLVAPGRALPVALDLAATIVRGAPLAVNGSKAVLSGAADWGLSDGWSRQQEIADPIIASQDAQEGARAFAERRAPVWTGR
ncbi:crotonase/enoyl-CoA hydratase family protein [Pseudonocardia broussonetiae]|uniref:Crotonase/enoyl-CoA hydratase family protein n=1 Tax=Pseudonocardia broussonetiae TaxID=2736640 RepID=A0A6M6JLI2_9PSEU|nr:crotonase/enoyl-CoA hydratase family protein [Pseudonocardia broussonetiae]QJY48063.1 crotonase/enoyl-CoA hydratase family protein [Pseudonocardia broussonetiae]